MKKVLTKILAKIRQLFNIDHDRAYFWEKHGPQIIEWINMMHNESSEYDKMSKYVIIWYNRS